MAETLIFLRLPDGEKGRPSWVRRNLFALGWSPIHMWELATDFKTRDAALAFAREYRIEKRAELVTVVAEPAHAA